MLWIRGRPLGPPLVSFYDAVGKSQLRCAAELHTLQILFLKSLIGSDQTCGETQTIGIGQRWIGQVDFLQNFISGEQADPGQIWFGGYVDGKIISLEKCDISRFPPPFDHDVELMSSRCVADEDIARRYVVQTLRQFAEWDKGFLALVERKVAEQIAYDVAAAG